MPVGCQHHQELVQDELTRAENGESAREPQAPVGDPRDEAREEREHDDHEGEVGERATGGHVPGRGEQAGESRQRTAAHERHPGRHGNRP